MDLPNWYDAWRKKIFMQVFTIYTRYLVGSAFVIAAIGMGKLDGSSNLIYSMDKPIQDLQPIQQFFRVMADSGLYWKFIGWSQIVCGALLMTQRFASLGALIYFGLILNIFIITISYNFAGTPVITGLMLMAATYLLLWDIRLFLPLVTQKETARYPKLALIVHPFWSWLGASIIFLILLCFFLTCT